MSADSNEEKLQALLAAPDTIDFITRTTPYMETCLSTQSDVARGALLMGQYSICYGSPKAVASITNGPGSSYTTTNSMVLTTLDSEPLEAAGIIAVQQQPYLDLRGRGVILGFVDTGIDYTLPIFRYEDGTSKILYIYDQTAEGVPPDHLPFGVEYTNEQINAALDAENPFDVVPENDNTTGHGTFIASVAAGREVDDFTSAAPDSEIIMVKLRRARPYYLESRSIPEDQPNAFESSDVMLGVEYILKKSLQLNRPVVICLGLGTNEGGHDCSTLFEEYLERVGNANGVCLCIAAGNESRARHHTQGAISATGETANIDIRVGQLGGDIIVSIRNNAADRLSVSITSPTGDSVARLPARPYERRQTQLVLENARVLVEYYFPVEA